MAQPSTTIPEVEEQMRELTTNIDNLSDAYAKSFALFGPPNEVTFEPCFRQLPTVLRDIIVDYIRDLVTFEVKLLLMQRRAEKYGSLQLKCRAPGIVRIPVHPTKFPW